MFLCIDAFVTQKQCTQWQYVYSAKYAVLNLIPWFALMFVFSHSQTNTSCVQNGQVRLEKNEKGHEVPKGNQLYCFTCHSRLGQIAKQKNTLHLLVARDHCLALLHYIKGAGPCKVPPTPARSLNVHISCALSYESYPRHYSLIQHT